MQVVIMELPFAGTWNHGAPTFSQYIAFMDAAGFAPFDLPETHRIPAPAAAARARAAAPAGAGGAVTAGDAGSGKRHSFLVQVDVVWLRKGSPYLRAVTSAIDAWGKR